MNRIRFPRSIDVARHLGTLLAASCLISACSPTPAQQKAQQSGGIYDPWEGYNRDIFAFNEKFDQYLFRPVAKGYVEVVPQYGRERVHNVLTNLKQPITFFNSVLQGDPGNAFSSFWSFTLNTTFGVLGIFDFAGTNTDLRVHPEDFGQTLGTWGVGNGPFFELPILGPSTVRDTGGLVADAFSDPSYYLMDEDLYYGVLVVNAVDTRAGLLDTLDDVHRNSLDPYATIRSGYLQKRDAQVHNSRTRGFSAGPVSTASPGQANAPNNDPAIEAEEEGLLPSTTKP